MSKLALDVGELQIIEILSEILLPPDERSVGAGAAGVPGFIRDLFPELSSRNREMIRLGVRWVAEESLARFGVAFHDARLDQQIAIVDDIAFPHRCEPRFRGPARFFSVLRDLVASGFWTSPAGYNDLGYRGGALQPEWDGCGCEIPPRTR